MAQIMEFILNLLLLRGKLFTTSAAETLHEAIRKCLLFKKKISTEYDKATHVIGPFENMLEFINYNSSQYTCEGENYVVTSEVRYRLYEQFNKIKEENTNHNQDLMEGRVKKSNPATLNSKAIQSVGGKIEELPNKNQNYTKFSNWSSHEVDRDESKECNKRSAKNNDYLVENLHAILKSQEFLFKNIIKLVTIVEKDVSSNKNTEKLEKIKNKLVACTDILSNAATSRNFSNIINNIIEEEITRCRFRHGESKTSAEINLKSPKRTGIEAALETSHQQEKPKVEKKKANQIQKTAKIQLDDKKNESLQCDEVDLEAKRNSDKTSKEKNPEPVIVPQSEIPNKQTETDYHDKVLMRSDVDILDSKKVIEVNEQHFNQFENALWHSLTTMKFVSLKDDYLNTCKCAFYNKRQFTAFESEIAKQNYGELGRDIENMDKLLTMSNAVCQIMERKLLFEERREEVHTFANHNFAKIVEASAETQKDSQETKISENPFEKLIDQVQEPKPVMETERSQCLSREPTKQKVFTSMSETSANLHRISSVGQLKQTTLGKPEINDSIKERRREDSPGPKFKKNSNEDGKLVEIKEDTPSLEIKKEANDNKTVANKQNEFIEEKEEDEAESISREAKMEYKKCFSKPAKNGPLSIVEAIELGMAKEKTQCLGTNTIINENKVRKCLDKISENISLDVVVKKEGNESGQQLQDNMNDQEKKNIVEKDDTRTPLPNICQEIVEKKVETANESSLQDTNLNGQEANLKFPEVLPHEAEKEQQDSSLIDLDTHEKDSINLSPKLSKTTVEVKDKSTTASKEQPQDEVRNETCCSRIGPASLPKIISLQSIKKKDVIQQKFQNTFLNDQEIKKTINNNGKLSPNHSENAIEKRKRKHQDDINNQRASDARKYSWHIPKNTSPPIIKKKEVTESGLKLQDNKSRNELEIEKKAAVESEQKLQTQETKKTTNENAVLSNNVAKKDVFEAKKSELEQKCAPLAIQTVANEDGKVHKCKTEESAAVSELKNEANIMKANKKAFDELEKTLHTVRILANKKPSLLVGSKSGVKTTIENKKRKIDESVKKSMSTRQLVTVVKQQTSFYKDRMKMRSLDLMSKGDGGGARTFIKAKQEFVPMGFSIAELKNQETKNVFLNSKCKTFLKSTSKMNATKQSGLKGAPWQTIEITSKHKSHKTEIMENINENKFPLQMRRTTKTAMVKQQVLTILPKITKKNAEKKKPKIRSVETKEIKLLKSTQSKSESQVPSKIPKNEATSGGVSPKKPKSSGLLTNKAQDKAPIDKIKCVKWEEDHKNFANILDE